MLDTAIQFFTIGARLVAGLIAVAIALWLIVTFIAVLFVAVVTFIATLFKNRSLLCQNL